jgi:hypothetical protein
MGRAIAQTAVTCETACTVETSGRHSAAPSSGPSTVPSTAPSAGPSVSDAPSSQPSSQPSLSSAPSSSPTAGPSVSGAPSSQPNSQPSTLSPTACSSPSDVSNARMESMVVSGVSSEWKEVTLSKQYLSPIAACTVEYNTGNNLLPALVRMDEVLHGSFKIRLQNPSDTTLKNGRDVHCVVVEEGSWVMPDGRKIEANTYVSKVTDYAQNSWVGEEQTYTNSYTNPVVLGQVMSFNDPKWSVFWSRGPNKLTAPSGSKLFTGKHVGEDNNAREDETVGYIVIETGHATSNCIETRQSVALILQTGMFKDKARSTPFILPSRPRQLLLFSLK